jgi:pimeloyl-ACP methyl ester carboxylesterase
MLKKIGIGFAALLALAACAVAQESPGLAKGPAAPVALAAAGQSPTTWMLHLPGIAGVRYPDEQMMLGLRDAGFAGALDSYDWTCANPGLGSLLAYKRNQAEAQKVADLIVERAKKQPGLRIIITGHSGGTGIAVWALEKLPADVKIDELILLASALSPGYDLSPALAHVRGKCYSFCSENDIVVLGTGTKMLGTIDGVKTAAAGQCGFCFPATGDAKQYDKLVQKAYDKSWMQYHNFGDHMGCMLRVFSQKVIAPLVVPVVPSMVKADTPRPAAERIQQTTTTPQHAAKS